MAKRCVSPRQPLDRRACVVSSCGRLPRWSVTLAAATRPSLRRLSAATPFSCGTNTRRFQANLLKARTCLCHWDSTSSKNGHPRDERGRGLQVFARSVHGFRPRKVHNHYPRRRSHCLARQKNSISVADVALGKPRDQRQPPDEYGQASLPVGLMRGGIPFPSSKASGSLGLPGRKSPCC